MQIFGVIVGILLILAALALGWYWWWRYPWPFQGLRADPIGTLVTAAFGVGMHFGGIYLIIWSLAH